MEKIQFVTEDNENVSLDERTAAMERFYAERENLDRELEFERCMLHDEKLRGKIYIKIREDENNYEHFVKYILGIITAAYRFSIAWSRVFPDGTGPVNEEGIQYYRDLIDELKANDIEPIVTLYHYDLPMALVDKYDGWISREVVKDFEYYARYVINEFKDKVKYWTTINEQSIIVQFIEQKCYIPEKYKGNRASYQFFHYYSKRS
mgnify:CR=1 FL=1